MAAMSPINKAFKRIPKRAEGRAATQLRDTFVDSGIADALDSIDHQVVFGRRGTGKTHAFSYLATTRSDEGDIGVFVDLRTIGSAEGIFDTEYVTPVQRTSRLLIDLIGHVHDAILETALDDSELIADGSFVANMDALLSSVTTLRVDGEVEVTAEQEQRNEDHADSRLGVTPRGVAAEASAGSNQSTRLVGSRTERGREQHSLNFADIARAFRRVASSLTSRRIWIVLDEWSSLPREVQPLLGAFLVRCVLPVQGITVKIAAIEQETRFRDQLVDGRTVGIELGADMTANVNLDQFMVFEQEQSKARSFFRGLLFKHLTQGLDGGERIPDLAKEGDVVRLGFTDIRAFDELVRAAEGVPRDAINIVGKAAMSASDRKISVPDIRVAARQWFQQDKEGALRDVPDSLSLLNWVIDTVIREKKARGFLVNQRSSNSPLLTALFDSRVLHLVRRGYSAQDEPGERYDVFVIDYGAYVDLINTQNAPASGPLFADDDNRGAAATEVPEQDLRALRRAVLDLDEFEASLGTR